MKEIVWIGREMNRDEVVGEGSVDDSETDGDEDRVAGERNVEGMAKGIEVTVKGQSGGGW